MTTQASKTPNSKTAYFTLLNTANIATHVAGHKTYVRDKEYADNHNPATEPAKAARQSGSRQAILKIATAAKLVFMLVLLSGDVRVFAIAKIEAWQ